MLWLVNKIFPQASSAVPAEEVKWSNTSFRFLFVLFKQGGFLFFQAFQEMFCLTSSAGTALDACGKILFTKHIIWRQNRSSYLFKVLPFVALPVILNVVDTCANLGRKLSLLFRPQTFGSLAQNPGGKHGIQLVLLLSRHARPFRNLFLTHDGEDWRWSTEWIDDNRSPWPSASH